jgi:3-hydroxyisobutyrate dehydrogenase-like beta-hydroxyacid dehydrogenase
MTTIAILGLGEAGRRYARGLAGAGATVHGFDPHHEPGVPGVEQKSELADALAAADAVLSLVHGAIAAEVAADAIPHLRADAVYADLNAASPATKSEIAVLARSCNVRMADVAVLAPVTRAGHRTPLLASGDGAAALADLLRPLGVPMEVLDDEAGAAARHKLLRSVFMKGLAALTIESLEAARAAGVEDWMRAQIAQELGPDGEAAVDRLVTGTSTHAARRAQEVRDALAELEASGVPTDMTRATLAWFERLVADRDHD